MSVKKLFTPLTSLLLISAAIRLLLAYIFPLGNDEAYYYTYAKYPDWSHFDHPSMVGWLIQLFSLNLYFSDELFIRLAAVVAGTVNTWLIFLLGKQLGDELSGWYSAMLYTASVYGFVIVGVFILPDAPQSMFLLCTLLFLTKAFSKLEPDKTAKKQILIASVFVGLGLLSKYTTAFLWVGMMAYILLYNRKWLRTKEFYLMQLIILLIFSPVLIWNYMHDFISFTFHGGRVEVKSWIPNLDSFLTTWAGEVIYTNPILWLLIIYSVIIYLRRGNLRKAQPSHLLLLSALPLIITFWIVSFFRTTLPHWSGLGYLTLIPILALLLRKTHSEWMPAPLKSVLAFMGFILILAPLQILTGFIPIEKIEQKAGFIKGNDYSLEMVGWHTLQKEFPLLAKKFEHEQLMPASAPIVTYRWFPAANYEYYVARKDNRPVLAAGDTTAIHGYIWINQIRGGFHLNTDAWYITSSRDFREPRKMEHVYYENVFPPDTIPVYRKNKVVYSFYVYRLKNLQSKRL